MIKDSDYISAMMKVLRFIASGHKRITPYEGVEHAGRYWPMIRTVLVRRKVGVLVPTNGYFYVHDAPLAEAMLAEYSVRLRHLMSSDFDSLLDHKYKLEAIRKGERAQIISIIALVVSAATFILEALATLAR